jgi:hypothetical protein
VPELQRSTGIRVAQTEALAMLWMSASGIADGWNDPAQYKNAVNGLVLGSLLDRVNESMNF